MAKVSVIINCFNGEEFLRDAIDSVYAQTWTNWEIIFWDNASTDRSAEIALSYDEHLKYFRNDENVPLGRARDQAMAEAQGEFVAFIDCDDIWLPDKLEKQIPLFESDPRTGLVFSDARLVYHATGQSRGYFAANHLGPPRGDLFRYMINSFCIPMSSVVLRRTMLDSYSEWFDEGFQLCTDYDFFLRIAHDWYCDYVNTPTVLIKIHDAAASVRYHSRLSEETQRTLEKLQSLYPDFRDHYSTEILLLEQTISRQKAKSLWKEGSPSQARQVLKNAPYSFKNLLIYLLTLLPYKWIAAKTDYLR